MEVRLHHFTTVVDAVVRLHNFCRRRAVSMPATAGGVRQSPVDFNKDDTIAGDFYRTDPRGRRGRPAGVLSVPREIIRRKLEVEGILRPAFNLERNKGRRKT